MNLNDELLTDLKENFMEEKQSLQTQLQEQQVSERASLVEDEHTSHY